MSPSAATESVTSPRDSVFFELDRLEMAGEDRLELSGRWYGVRGRRFVRPTLTLLGPGGRRRALADLEHKPWAAEDGEAWTAAFPWELEGPDVNDLELAVAPDIAVALPSPGGRSRRRRSVATGSVRVVPRQAETAGALRDALELARAEIARLRAELERAGAAQVEIGSALARRDAAVGALAAVEAERDAAVGALAAVEAERDAAVAARDAAAAARDAAVAERDRGLRARQAALRARERGAQDVEAALAERDAARRERDQALQARDQAVQARDEALRARESRAEPAPAPAAPAPAPAPPAPPAPAPALATRVNPITPGVRLAERRGNWVPRMIAFATLAVAILALLIIIRSA